MTISASFPNLRPSLLLDFSSTKALDPRVTFSRPTTATYYDGITSAVAEQNLFTYSNTFNNAAWVATNATVASGVTDPSGGTTAFSLTANSANGTLYQTLTLTATAYTVSFWIQRVTGTGTINLTLDGTNFTAVAITSSWVKYTATTTPTAGAKTIGIQIVTSGDAINIYGAQIENRSSATATNITTTTAITNYIPVLQTATSNTPRFDNNPTTGESLGLLIEEQRTNLLTYSSAFDNVAWTKTACSMTTAADIAPDGTQTAQLFIPNSGATIGSGTSLYQRVTLASGAIAISIYVKANQLTTCNLQDSSGNGANFNLSTGVVSSNTGTGVGSITSVGNGWYRCVVTIASAAANPYLYFYPTSGTANGFNGIYIWGAQLEAGAFPTSYIPTVASQVTRSADSASELTSSWYNNQQGSFYCEAARITNNTTYAGLIGSSSSSLPIYCPGSANISIYDGVSAPYSTVSNFAAFNKISTVYGNSNKSSVVNGGTVATNTYTNIGFNGITAIAIGNASTSSPVNFWNGWIKKISYYPLALTNSQIQALTGS